MPTLDTRLGSGEIRCKHFEAELCAGVSSRSLLISLRIRPPCGTPYLLEMTRLTVPLSNMPLSDRHHRTRLFS